jgi:hypothetical protein
MEPVDVRVARIGRTQFGTATRPQLVASGVDVRTIRRRLASGAWGEPLPRVIDLRTHPASWEQRLMQHVLAAGEGAVASHRCAAYLHGFLDIDEPAGLDVMVPRGRRTRVGGLVLRTSSRLTPEEVCRVGSFPLTTPERTLLDLTPVLAAVQVESILWEAVRRAPDLPQRIAESLARHPRAPGRRELTRMLGELRPEIASAESPLEILGLLALRRAGAPPPDLQVSVRDGSGRFLARVDAAWPRARVIVEFDGAAYHGTRTGMGRDERQRAALRREGWHVIVMSADDIRRPARSRRIAREIRERLAR